jgi:hypothetical protein
MAQTVCRARSSSWTPCALLQAGTRRPASICRRPRRRCSLWRARSTGGRRARSGRAARRPVKAPRSRRDGLVGAETEAEGRCCSLRGTVGRAQGRCCRRSSASDRGRGSINGGRGWCRVSRLPPTCALHRRGATRCLALGITWCRIGHAGQRQPAREPDGYRPTDARREAARARAALARSCSRSCSALGGTLLGPEHGIGIESAPCT